MTTQATSEERAPEVHPPVAMDRVIQESGLSPCTWWRYRQRGWITTIVIAGRHYVTREAMEEFNRRAAAGEFAGKVKQPRRR